MSDGTIISLVIGGFGLVGWLLGISYVLGGYVARLKATEERVKIDFRDFKRTLDKIMDRVS